MKSDGLNKIVTTVPIIENKIPSKVGPLVHVVKKADEQGLGILSTRTIHTESLTMLEGGIDERMCAEVETNINRMLKEYVKRAEGAQNIDPDMLNLIREMMPRVRLFVRDNTAQLTIAVKPVKLEEIKTYMDKGDFGLVDKEDEKTILLPRNSVHTQEIITTTEGEVFSTRVMTQEEETEFEEVREAFLEIYMLVNKPNQKEAKESTKTTSTHVETKAAPQKRSVEVDKKTISHKENKLPDTKDRKKVTVKMTAAAEKKREEIRKEAIEKEEFGKELSKKRERKGLEADHLLSTADKQEYSHNLGKSHKFNKIPRAA